MVLPVSEKFNDYAENVKSVLAIADIRGLVDDRNESIGRKIRDTELKRIPFMLIVGDKEVNDNKVSVRRQGQGDLGQMSVAEFEEYFIKLASEE
jgi:threonyl-tRNA synthetase